MSRQISCGKTKGRFQECDGWALETALRACGEKEFGDAIFQ